MEKDKPSTLQTASKFVMEAMLSFWIETVI